jgi:hypothetical protein
MTGMDAGWAAVLGATVGVVGTLGSAMLTYAATRSQVHEAGRVEHEHWVRDKRQQLYLDFIDTLDEWDAAVDAMGKAMGRPYQTEPDGETFDRPAAVIAAGIMTEKWIAVGVHRGAWQRSDQRTSQASPRISPYASGGSRAPSVTVSPSLTNRWAKRRSISAELKASSKTRPGG